MVLSVQRRFVTCLDGAGFLTSAVVPFGVPPAARNKTWAGRSFAAVGPALGGSLDGGGLLVVQLASVAGLGEGLDVRRQALGDRLAVFQLGVHLGAEEEGDV